MALVGVLALAGVWRAVMAVALPVISRDGVVFCDYARALGEQGVAYLRTPEARQHPLFPLLILGTQRVARGLGAADTPLTWQRSGQALAWLAGMTVVVLCGVLAGRLVTRLSLPLDRRGTVLLAMLLAAVLDHNIWLSADVMSDQVHLAFYLAAACLLVTLDSGREAAACGLLAGLAFLTRPEGALPAVAGVLALLRSGKAKGWPRTGGQIAALLCGFLICAAPYWATVGRLSGKKDPADWLRTETAKSPPPHASGYLSIARLDQRMNDACRLYDDSRFDGALSETRTVVRGRPATGVAGSDRARRRFVNSDSGGADPAKAGIGAARLVTVDLRWYELIPHVLYKVLRAGRVVVPLLAVLPLTNLRRRWWEPGLVGLTTCIAGHFLLLLILLSRYGYLDPRHTLVIVVLLLPFAAMFLGRLIHLARQHKRASLAVLTPAVWLIPLVMYSLRVPNSKDRYLLDATRWLQKWDPSLGDRRLIGGSGVRRIAFYAQMRWERWADDPNDVAALRALLTSGGAGYFAIELDPSGAPRRRSERAGNRELLDRLWRDSDVGARVRLVHVQPGPDGSELRLYGTAMPATTAAAAGAGDGLKSDP